MNYGYIAQQQLATTISYFVDKNATTPDTAIPMNAVAWAKLGHLNNPVQYSLFNPYSKLIRVTEDDRYYIDEQRLEKMFEEYPATTKKIIMYFFVLILLMLVLTSVFQ